MNKWVYTLDVSDFWRQEDMSLEEKSKAFIGRIKTQKWYGEMYYFGEMEELLEEFSDAGEADDPVWFDACTEAIYDIFDAERIWMKTS